MSSISATGTLYIRYSTGNIDYSTDNTSWSTISAWPATIINTNTSQTLKVLFTTDILIVQLTNYFIAGSDNIQFGNTSLNSNGTRPIIKKNPLTPGFSYSGLVQNGTNGGNGYNNIIIVNLVVDGTNLILSGGWIAQSFFAYGASNNKIVNCSSIGDITPNNGGIVGQFVATNNGNLQILYCSSSGNINTNAGGIVGQGATNNDGGVVIATQCFSTGQIGQLGGGIYGPFAGNSRALNCYSTGNIIGGAGVRTGGIYGRGAGTEIECFATNCYSQGAIGLGCAGIDADGSFTHVVISNCYSSGSIANTAGGIQGSGAVVSVPFNCYTSGLSIAGAIGGIRAGLSGDGATNYSEANSGGNTGNWSDTNAALALTGIGTTWLSLSLNTPFVLNNFGTSPYTLNNINPATYSLIQTFSQTVSAGNSTIAAVAANYKSFQIVSGGHPTITISSTGQISTTTSTPVGVYTLLIYGVDDYTTTTFVLTVLEANAVITQNPFLECCYKTETNKNPQTSIYDDSIIAINKTCKAVSDTTDVFYAGISVGIRGAYSQPFFQSHSDYIKYLQGKTV